METLKYNNLDSTASYPKLKILAESPVDLKEALTAERIESYTAPAGGGLVYNYAAKLVDSRVLTMLQELSDEQQLIPKFRGLVNGERMNTGEDRMVLHHLCRGRLGEKVEEQGVDKEIFYTEQKERFYDFARRVHEGKVKGSTGKKFETVVQIGIGGSDLGPRALYLALENYAAAQRKHFMKGEFISNVDPDDASAVLSRLDFETTLFILVTKSGTTQETLTNRDFVFRRLEENPIPGFDPKDHMVAVTGKSSPLARSSEFAACFFIDDYIGGRYSATSAVGGLILSLAFGPELFDELLHGAHEADKIALNTEIIRNGALLDALIGVFERNFLGFPAAAVLPYSQALLRFPAHLQQLDMESNGKRVNRFAEPILYPTGPVLFGEPGTNGQHSFYQLLHQGMQIVPLQFVGFKSSQLGSDIEADGSTSQEKL
ncbi:MAG: glucose-6-phosphate isomerase, partial [Spirochaetia bacterium]